MHYRYYVATSTIHIHMVTSYICIARHVTVDISSQPFLISPHCCSWNWGHRIAKVFSIPPSYSCGSFHNPQSSFGHHMVIIWNIAQVFPYFGGIPVLAWSCGRDMSKDYSFVDTDNEDITDESIEELIDLKRRPKRQKVAPARYRNQIQDTIQEALLAVRYLPCCIYPTIHAYCKGIM